MAIVDVVVKKIPPQDFVYNLIISFSLHLYLSI